MHALLLICAMAIGQDAKNQESADLWAKGPVHLEFPADKLAEFERAVLAAGLKDRVQIKDGKATIESPVATEVERLRAIEKDLAVKLIDHPVAPTAEKPAAQDSTGTTLEGFEKAGWEERKIPLAAEKSKAEVDAIVEKLKKDGALRYRFEKHDAANDNQHFVVACSPLIKQLDAFENELRAQGFLTSVGGNDVVTKSFNVETDLIADIQDELKPKLPAVKIERGDRHYTIKVHGNAGDLAKAEKLLADRGWLSSRQEKTFKLRNPKDGPSFAKIFNVDAFRRLGAKDVNIAVGFDPNSNSVVAKGTKEELAIIEALVARLDQPNKSETSGPDREENAFDLTGDPFVQHFVIANGKTPIIRENIGKNKVRYAITNFATHDIVSISSFEKDDLARTEKSLKEMGAINTEMAANVIRLKPGTSKSVGQSIGKKKTDSVYDPASNSLLVFGTPVEVAEAEAIAANSKVSQETPAGKKFTRRRIPIALDKKDAIVEAVKALKIELSEIAFSKEDSQHILIIESTTEESLNEVQDTLANLGLVAPATSVKAFSLKHAKADLIANSLQFKGTGARIAIDARTNRLIVTGTKAELAQVEVLVAQLDLPQASTGPDQAKIDKTSGDQRIVKLIPSTEAKLEEFENLVMQLGLKEVRLGYDLNQKSVVVSATAEQIEQIEKALQKDQTGRAMRVFHLQHTDAVSIAQTLNLLKIPNMTIVADAQSNGVIATGSSGDINIVEALLSNLDVQRASDRKAAKNPIGPDSDLRNYVYHLKISSASEVASSISKMEIDGVRIIADERTNSVIVQAGVKELKLVIRIIQTFEQKDFKVDDSKLAAPDPVVGTLWSDFAKAEAKSIATAGELRAAATKLGDSHPTMTELRTRLETDVKIAFEFRHKLQQAEAAALRQQLGEIEQRLAKREKNRAAIIKSRIESLLNLDELGWEAMSKPKATKEAVTSGANPLVSENAAKGLVGVGNRGKELSEAWERVDRDEYIPVKIPLNFGGMGMGGFGGMGGMGGGFPGAASPAAAPAPITPQHQQGVLIGGNAMIRDSYGLYGDQVVWFGAKQLPSRLAAVGPFSIHAYRSARFPSQGVTDFTHKSKEEEQVWAFAPDQMQSLVKAKVFHKSGAEFAIDEKTSFGIEAEGKIETGYIVCTNQGDFLGIVSYNYGSLGACWSAPAIGDWLKRTNLEEPNPQNPLDGRVIIALAGSAYTQDPAQPVNTDQVQTDRTFYGSVIKGVIVTHPDVSKVDLANSGKILYGGRTLSWEKMRLTENKRFTLIWCKELTPQSGFVASHSMVLAKESVVPLGTRARSVESYTGKSKTTHVLQPTTDDIPAFETAIRARTVASKVDKTNFEMEWLGIYNSIGLPVVTTGGHFLGVVDSDKPISVTTSQELQTVSEHHTVHVISSEEMLRFVDEEVKKGASGTEVVANVSPAANPSDSKPHVDSETSKQEAREAFSKRIKEPEAAIVVSVDQWEPGQTKTTRKRWRGTIVDGCILVPQLIEDDEYIQVDSKSLPQRLAGITPGGIHVYHRDRLPKGFTKFAEPPKEGDQVWTVAPLGSGRNMAMGAQVIALNETTKGMGANDKFTFAVESDFKAEPGTAVFNDEGELVGIVATSRGSLAICEHISSITDYLKRITVTPPNPLDATGQLVDFQVISSGKIEKWQGVLVQGVLVSRPDLIDQDFSKLHVQIRGRQGLSKLTKRHAVKILGDRLALIWCDEIKPETGIRAFRPSTIAGDFAFASATNSNWGGMRGLEGVHSDLVNKGHIRATRGAPGAPLVAARITKVRDTDFDLYWYGHYGAVGDAVFDPGAYLLGVNVAKPPAEGAAPDSLPGTTVIKAAEIFRAIEEESKKLAAAMPSDPESPKSETVKTDPPKEGDAPPR